MLTLRQKQLLAAIISEFIESAQAVGSIDLPEKYDLAYSPATIRNEMATLVRMGYLDKPHSSSGRIPTTLAFRYFLPEIMEELDVVDIKTQAIIGEDLFQKRHNVDQLVLSAVRSLNEMTENAAVALIDDRIYHSGLHNLLDNPEFRNLDKLKNILMILEDYSQLSVILGGHRKNGDVKILIGEEIGSEVLESSAIVFSEIVLHGSTKGYIAIIGPNRMRYRNVIPSIKYISDKIADVLREWKY